MVPFYSTLFIRNSPGVNDPNHIFMLRNRENEQKRMGLDSSTNVQRTKRSEMCAEEYRDGLVFESIFLFMDRSRGFPGNPPRSNVPMYGSINLIC